MSRAAPSPGEALLEGAGRVGGGDRRGAGGEHGACIHLRLKFDDGHAGRLVAGKDGGGDRGGPRQRGRREGWK